MYQALNNRVIATPLEDETKTESGIILDNTNQACFRYKVTHTNELTKDLQDKVVYAEARWKNYQLTDLGPKGEKYVVIPLDEVLAVQA